MSVSGISKVIGILAFCDCATLMAEQDCLSLWQQNPVSESCRSYVSATAPDQVTPMLVDLENGQCRMTLLCKNRYGASTPNLARDVEKTELKKIHNCNGELQLEPCPVIQSEQGQ
ncbi:hypothetical protein FQ192_23260 [Pseudomonas sp. ANT_J12]|uniref:hypothetical protein n=1 Tax=Pseudomonas sp. ANT_J12 TaxID=2597351 RepID=UPI0011F4018A|nr:hypothetical protein [Pseudomonas sp. ANT_J12]KAA0986557.1 hypothetical protein FQ192_23260 [Pseudomonas sp. ANT_J12]